MKSKSETSGKGNDLLDVLHKLKMPEKSLRDMSDEEIEQLKKPRAVEAGMPFVGGGAAPAKAIAKRVGQETAKAMAKTEMSSLSHNELLGKLPDLIRKYGKEIVHSLMGK